MMKMKRKKKILIIDDEDFTQGFLKRVLEPAGYQLVAAYDGEQGIDLFKKEVFDLVLLDLKLPGSMNGMQILQQLKIMQPHALIVMMSGHGTADIAVEAVKMGAEDFISKPFPPPEEVLLRIEKALEHQRILMENAFLYEQLALQTKTSTMIGKSAKMREIQELIKRVAPSDTTVLLTGESGTGKELLARTLHNLSPRAAKPFVAINCGALPDTLLESELFGYNKGAFSEAYKDKLGRFDLAEGGTLFLDEIGEASLNFQVKLLRVLQTGEFQRVGGHETLYADVRIISATNKDLAKAVEEGKFREDLYFRINVINIELPPLRERKEDIPLLAYFFLKKFSEKEKKNVTTISPEAMNLLKDFSWPGNIRELENVIKRGVILCEGDTIDVSCLPNTIRNLHPALAEKTDTFPLNYKEAKKMFEISYLKKLLQACGGDKTAAAKISGLNQATIYRDLRKYHIKPADYLPQT